jgi:RHS repeat-associated protein
MRIWAGTPSQALATPASLNFMGDSSVVVLVTNNNHLAQVYAPQTLANIVAFDAYDYEICFYHAAQVGAPVDGIYPTNGLTPYVTWLVQNPNTTNDDNTIMLTETRGASSWVYTYIYNPVINSWTYISPGGVSQTQYITTSNPDGSRVLTQIIGGTNGSVAQVFSRTYQTFSWGEGVVSETVGTGASAKTTTKTYYDNIPPNGSFVPLEGVVNSDGSWTYYCPLPSSDGTYLPYCESSSIGNSSRLLFYDYTPLGSDDGTQEPRTARTVIEQVNGQESSRAYLILLPGERHDIRCVRPYANWSDSDNLVTVTKYYTSGPNIFRVQSVANPDGTMAFYDYASSTNGWQTNTVSTGQPNSRGTVIADGTQTTTILDSFGQTVLVTVRDLASGGTILRQDAYGNFDALDRAQLVTHLDGTTETFDYDCCHLAGSVDRDGVATGYLYDAAKRNYGYAKFYDSTNPITYQNVLDAADRVVQSQRIGSDGSMITLSQSGYDTAGRLVAQTNALGGVTTYVESNDPATGGLIRTTTYPDLGTRIDSYYADGSLKSVAGTAVHPVRYEYGAGSDDNGNSCTYTKEVKQNNDLSDSSEWTQTYTDMAGRSTETLYAGDGHYDFSLGQYFSGPSSRSFYNSKGQLWKQVDPDGVATLYQYNAKGELAYTAVDMDQNDTIDFGGADRITWTTNDVTTDHGTAVSRSQTFVWATTGVNHASPVSVSETSVNGQNSWQTKYGDANTTVTSQSQISYSSPSRSVTTIAPDGTYTINTFSYGRLISSTRYDSGHAQIGSTTYAYDAHGRQHQVTDARNGTTTYGYNSADQVNSVTTPKPGSGQSAETTTTAYDQMLRPFSVTQPDGAVVNSVYLLTGELGLQSGSRTYPVAYGYDYAGRMQTMTNWSSFNSLDGARGTTWNYDSRRGFLASKAYADGNGPAYIYTPGGRLQTRTWVRTDANGTPISTTYAYDPAGSLTNVSYSDATPVVSYAYDRLGRQSTVAWSNITETLTYNLANELLGEAYSGGALNGLSVTNGYDSYLRRATLAARSGSTALAAANYGYDNASRLSTVSDANGDTVTNIYLANSPLVGQIAFNQGSSTRMTTTKQYDSLNRLTQVSSQPSASGLMPIAFNYNYNPANQRTKNTLADGSYWIYGYDALGQVTNACKFWRDGTAVAGQQFDYAFDTIGNRTQTKAGGDATGQNLRVANYSANNLNQIISRDVPALVDVLGVSLVTNTVTVNGQPAYRKAEYFRQQLAADNSASSLWFNLIVAATGQTSVTGSVYVAQSPEQFSYDPDGNLTNDGRWAYTWDAENRLVTMTVTPNVGPQYQLAFAYDPKGRRIQKTVATNGVAVSTNKFLYDGWNLVAELQPNNAPIRSYVWGNDLSGSQQGAGGVGGLLEVSCYGTTTTNCFPAFDGNGNVAALINAADGTIVANYEYAAFGEPIRVTGAMARNNPFRFSTKYSDDESDLLYYGHRYYRPSTGSWINRDQIEEKGGLNIFGFTKNNPIINYDINGNITVKRLTPDPIADNCGGYDVYFEFTLEHAPDKDGYIVQKVTYTANWTVGFPNPAIPTESHSLNKTYWEAWFVKAGQTTVTTAKLGYTDHAGDWARPSSYGTSTSSGEIKFFYTETTKDLGDPGATPPKAPSPSTGWSEDPNNTTWWGMLPHTGDPDGTPVPTWWNNSPDNGEPAASRSVTANWKCTCARVSIQTDGKVSASP